MQEDLGLGLLMLGQASRLELAMGRAVGLMFAQMALRPVLSLLLVLGWPFQGV